MFRRISNPLFLVSFLLFIGCNESEKKEKQQVNRPNVIIIVTDDQGYGDLGYHGNPIIKTPNLDTFASSAFELTNFHVGTTCAPTRAGIMTGRNANRNNAWHTIAGCSILEENEQTIAEVFAQNDYATAMFGKWHLGDNYPFRPHDRGFQNAVYNGGGGVGQTPDYWDNDYFDDTYFRNGVPEKFEGYCTDIWFNEAKKFIQKREDERPFFMYLATNAAHWPFNVPEEYAKKYTSAELTEDQKRFYGMISNIDDNFGELVALLRTEKLFEDTIIIFTTDNGTALGIHYPKDGSQTLGFNGNLRGVKGSHYDGGHKVPFFISWPNGNIKKQSSSDALTAHVDLLPTLAELTSIDFKPKKVLDGSSMAGILEGASPTDRMLVVDTQRNQWPEKGKNPCVMDGPWRLVNGEELYNTSSDIGQKNDVALQYPERVSKMKEFYDSWWSSVEPEIRYSEIPLGNENANEVLLTIHDMHTQDNLPWNQFQIRKAEAKPKGYYSVSVEKTGRYRFHLRRYPQESQMVNSQFVQAIESTPYRDGAPEGKGVKVTGAVIKLNDKTLNVDNLNTTSNVIIEGDFEKGSATLESHFVLEDGSYFPAYYTLVEYMSNE
ncbi:arylsulfatase [Croceitalea marina]|uniref:Arylsulfatase n=1 Tax=Croceitalea marina TaxID=1775166 RepID=A0ABW5MW65_9FLAO